MFAHIKNILFVMTVAVGVAGAGVAHAVTCPAPGYYLNDAGECAECYSSLRYCPGDNTIQTCPAARLYVRTTFPAKYYNPKPSTFSDAAIKGNTNIKQCMSYVIYTSDRGEFFEYAYYNTETNEYDITYEYGFDTAYPGYYLTDKTGRCGNMANYYNAVECPAGGYCPGKARVRCDSSNQATVYTTTFGLEVCPDNTYSDAGATECKPCPDGWGNTGNNLADHAGAASCNKCVAGYYMDTDGKCTICNYGYYCPGDNTRQSCPPSQSSGTWCANRLIKDVVDAYGCTSITHCLNNSYQFSSEHGGGTKHCFYNPTLGRYDENICDSIHLTYCDAGYYDSLNGDYWRGTDTPIDCIPAGIGYYSPTGALGRTACTDGTSTRTDTATSATDCVPLCTFGGKKLHAGKHEFNIWPNGTCTSPSIGIGLPNGTCCVNLESGAGTGINVEWDGKTYHTVN